jgi:glycosyltransferase involved in cell wall biosynthesis
MAVVRVLHLADSEAALAAQRGVLYLSRDLGDGFAADVRMIGRGGEDRNLPAAVLGLRREGTGFDVLHAWGQRALLAAAMGTTGRIVYSPGEGTRAASVRWTRAVLEHRDVQVACATATQRRVFIERGVPAERCHLIRPGVEFGKVKRRRDARLREALGFADNDYVLLAAGESTRGADHRLAVWTGAILHVLDPRYKMLLWGRGPLANQVKRLADRQHQPGLVSVAEQCLARRVEFEELMPAADLVLVSATGAVDTLPIAIAMAAGLPIVSTVTYMVSELLEDRHTALMVGNPSPRALAQRILDLRADAGLQWTIADAARVEAYEYFSMTRFLNQWRGVYRQVACGEKVEVPEERPGAGLRFHGRA